GRRAGKRAAGQPSRRLPAPQGAQGRRTRDRPPRRQSPHLPARPAGRRRAARVARPLLEPSPGGVQGDRRRRTGGELMSTPATDTSVRTSIVVDTPIARAFSVFTDDIGSWWNPEHHIIEVELAEMVFEPRAGGHVYDRGVDGSECRWARVLVYEPPHRVVF